MRLLEAHGIAMTGFDQVVRRIGADEWHLPTPCTEWTVRDLVNHLVSEQLWVPHLLAGQTMSEVGDQFAGDVLGHDPVSVWTDAAAAARAAWTEEGALDRSVNVTAGVIDAQEYGWQMTTDLAVHSWDLAQAISVEAPVDPDLAELLIDKIAPSIEGAQSAGVFAPSVAVSSDATAVDRLVALVGRDPQNPLPVS